MASSTLYSMGTFERNLKGTDKVDAERLYLWDVVPGIGTDNSRIGIRHVGVRGSILSVQGL